MIGWAPAADPATSILAAGGGRIISGRLVRGSLTQYRFTVPAGIQSVFRDIQNCSSLIRRTLTNTTTNMVNQSRHCYGGDRQIDNLPAGQYTLEFFGTSDAHVECSTEQRHALVRNPEEARRGG